MANRPRQLIDSQGRTIALGSEIGKGGEGSVYQVQGDRSLVVKLYHKLPLSNEHAAKLEAMVQRWSPELEQISAWPRSIVYDAAGRQSRGIVMRRLNEARHLHELYGTTTRRQHFSEIGWHHLVLAARNVAAAFATLHEACIVVGDVNQGNVMVDPSMRISLIDCDSFQIDYDGFVFCCPVGTPHFTPAELQNKKLGENPRTVAQDAFGMAVLIFHLLFVGRHPFAGRLRDGRDLSIVQSIAQQRFAFSNHRDETFVDPPPASLQLSDLPGEFAPLFESAFRSSGDEVSRRPGPVDWAGHLELLMKSCRTCSIDDQHVFFRELTQCPWCRIEDEGGPAFFSPATTGTLISEDRLAQLDEKIDEMHIAQFVDLPPARLRLPALAPLKKADVARTWTGTDTLALVMLLSAVVCIAGAFHLALLVAGSSGIVMCGAILWRGQGGRKNRETQTNLNSQLAKHTRRLARQADAIQREHKRRYGGYSKNVAELELAIEYYFATGDQLRELLGSQRDMQLAEHMRGHLIRDHAEDILGMTMGNVSMLESYGIESAMDVDSLTLCAIPNIDDEVVIELLQWRSQVESEFQFQPNQGITFEQLKLSEDQAVRRFKVAQARKVLTGARQLQTLCSDGEAALIRDLTKFDAMIKQWRKAAGELRSFQSKRSPAERLINRSAAMILSIAVGVPLVAAACNLLMQ